jgi:HlyD family secretion protein
MPEDRKEQLELLESRSEDVQEILGYIPRWIVRWGITVIFVSIIVLLVGSWFFKYPDIIKSSVVVTTENPPADIITRSSGKLQHLFVKDKAQVEAGEALAVVENAANHNHVFQLKEQLQQLKPFIARFDYSLVKPVTRSFSLGQVQAGYELFLKNLEDHRQFFINQYHQKKIQATTSQVQKNQELFNQLLTRKKALLEQVELSKKQFDRVKKMLKEQVVSPKEFEQAKSQHLQKQMDLYTVEASLTNTTMKISDLRQLIMETSIQERETRTSLQLALKQSFDNLNSQISQWEYNYLLKSPIPGQVTFNKFWSVNQNVKAGDIVLTVVPEKSGPIIGKLFLPIAGSGKVKVGQKVNIKFSNYPHMEYGMVQGIIKTISMAPSDSVYLVEVGLPNGLLTNYGNKLGFNQKMQGNAEIITEDIRVLERVFQPLKALFKKHTAKQ